jgi:ribosomal protein L21E
MKRFTVGDRVRVDIPDRDDPDFNDYHGRRGEVVDVSEDAAHTITGDSRDSVVYRIRLDGGDEIDFRWRDLRPVER